LGVGLEFHREAESHERHTLAEIASGLWLSALVALPRETRMDQDHWTIDRTVGRGL